MPITKTTINEPKITENDYFEEVDIINLKGKALAYAFAVAVGIPVFVPSNKQLDLSLTGVNSNSEYTKHKGDLLNITIFNELLYRNSRKQTIPVTFNADYKTLGWYIDEYPIMLLRSTVTEVTAAISKEGHIVNVIGSTYVEAAMRTIVAYELKQDSIYVPVVFLKK